MPLTYVVPDLHGRADLLERALEAIQNHAGETRGRIVILGDYVDKGPSSCQVIERLMLGAGDGWSLICLKGNHDALMLAACKDPGAMPGWLEKGGDAALRSYGIEDPADIGRIPASHLAWLTNCALMHVDAHRIYVHAGLDSKVGLKKQVEATLLWKRYGPKEAARGYRGRHIVHGHDSSASNPLILPGRTNLDALAWKTGHLVIGIYDDDQPGSAISYLDIRGAPAGQAERKPAPAEPESVLVSSQPATLWERFKAWLHGSRSPAARTDLIRVREPVR